MYFKSVKIRMLLAAAVLAAGLPAAAEQVSLNWSAPSQNIDGSVLNDLAGYRVYHGFSSGNYDAVHDVGNVTQALIDGAVAGSSNYFAVTAYDADGMESTLSGEVVWSGGDFQAADADGDGMPDEWEALYSESGDMDPAADDDEDGMSNHSEYLAGTAPTDAASALQLMRISAAVDGGIEVRWQSVEGKRYTLLKTFSLDQPFLPVASNQPATAPENVYVDPAADQNVMAFYKIQLE